MMGCLLIAIGRLLSTAARHTMNHQHLFSLPRTFDKEESLNTVFIFYILYFLSPANAIHDSSKL